jgi:glycosyltransferase involved in cell wall biosynthesis
MRITFLMEQADMSGGTRVVAIYARLLAELGHRVTVLSLPVAPRTTREWLSYIRRIKKLPPPIRQPKSHFDGAGIDHRILPSHAGGFPDDLIPDGDILMATWWETVRWVENAPKSKGAKVHLVQHYEDWGWRKEGLDDSYRAPLKKICVSQWLQDLLRERFSRDSWLIPNGVDTGQFTAPPRGKQATPTVGMMWSPVAFKGCDYTLDAFCMARKNIPSLRLIAFGADDPDRALPEGTTFTRQPAQDKIKDYYAACDAWLFGSRTEGFGLPLLEAMACRTPLIATHAGAAPELVAEGGGVMVDMNDPADMARQIERIANLPDAQWRQMSDLAHASAQKRTWPENGRLLERVLTDILAGALPPAVDDCLTIDALDSAAKRIAGDARLAADGRGQSNILALNAARPNRDILPPTGPADAADSQGFRGPTDASDARPTAMAASASASIGASISAAASFASGDSLARSRKGQAS